MTNISIFQPKDESASLPVTLPHTLVMLKRTDINLESFLPTLQRFLGNKEHQVLKKLRGSIVVKEADFLDEVRKLIVITTLSCGKLGSL